MTPGKSGEKESGESQRAVSEAEARKLLLRAGQGLFDACAIARDTRQARARFLALSKAERDFELLLKHFIGTLNEPNRTLLDDAEIFEGLVDLTVWLAAREQYYGTICLKAWAEGGFGFSAGEVRRALAQVRRVLEVDADLALALIKGYGRLTDRLREGEIEAYVAEGLGLYERNRGAAIAFLEGSLRRSETAIAALSTEARLIDVRAALTNLLCGLAGVECEIHDLDLLAGDEVARRGTMSACFGRKLFLPNRVRRFESAKLNRGWYLLATLVAGAMLTGRGFATVHGRGIASCEGMVGGEVFRVNCFQMIEAARVLGRMRREWPGARSLLRAGLEREFSGVEAGSGAALLAEALGDGAEVSQCARVIREMAGESDGAEETAALLADERLAEVRGDYPVLEREVLRPVSFIPDAMLKVEVSETEEQETPKPEEPPEEEPDDAEPVKGEQEQAPTPQPVIVEKQFVYDEWSEPERDYRRDFCTVHEMGTEKDLRYFEDMDVSDDAQRVRRVFERIKPVLVKREKYLAEGDYINPDLLVNYLVQRRREPSPKVDFYERPQIQRRDLAVMILMDVSNSTNERAGERRVLEIEKHAALVFAEGLVLLGDRFAICGFSGNGPDNCCYFVYKDFEEPWCRETRERVLSASPFSSTRIGAALRHAGRRLADVEAKQRLILLITDGQPDDIDYSPATRYAHHDVRMACVENRRRGIHTFCISTDANDRSDMDLMFPERRYAILADIRELPQILPKMYVALTL